MSDKLSGSLQENLLVLLCWSDKSFQLIRNSVTPNLFTTAVYRDIIGRVYDYIDRFKKPPKNHLPDLLEDELEDPKSGELYRGVMEAVMTVKDSLNEEYIVTELGKWIRLQTMKLGIIKAHEFMQQGQLEEAEVELEKSLKERLSLFSPGTTLEDALKKIERQENVRDVVPIGIPEMDKHKLGPARKELCALIGPKKGGKTWWLIHCAKRALMINWRVAIITLELNETLYATRLMQSMYSVRERRADTLRVMRFEKDALGRISDYRQERIERPAMEDPAGLKYVRGKLEQLPTRKRLRIKEFPTSMLTTAGIEAYLDSLERLDNFIPDMLIVDYPKIMKLDPRNLRVELGHTYERIRGICNERNLAGCIVAQSNREGVKSGTIKDTDVGEDFSLNQTADIVFTYSQTEAEYQLGLARLHNTASRIGRQNVKVMLSQNYDIGQFVLDSAPMHDQYWDSVKQMSGKNVDIEVDGGESE